MGSLACVAAWLRGERDDGSNGGSGEQCDGPRYCSVPGERTGEHDGERAARSTVVNCAEMFGFRVIMSCHTVIAAAQGDLLEANK